MVETTGFENRHAVRYREFESPPLRQGSSSMEVMKKASDFTARVYAVAAKIPKGKVATYGQLARLSGSPRAARAVGMAMRNNPHRNIVPCHRVVGAKGALIGYAFGKGVETKHQILKREGIVFTGNRVNLLRSGWKA